MNFEQKQLVVPAAVLAAGLVLAALVGSYTFYRVRAMDNTLAVTGSATQAIQADSAKWTLTVSRSSYESEIPSMQRRVASDVKAVSAFFTKAGIAGEDISTNPASVDQEYNNDSNAPRRYTIRQQVTVASKDPDLMNRLSKEVGSLLEQGILLSAGQPEYYVSTLPQIRVALIGKAVEDARARATSIAESTGQKVGALKAASSGVVQVMSPNSVDVSDYGSYDTSTIDKQVMVTARATFFLR